MKDNRIFWLHFEGDDAKKEKIKTQVLSKYLLEFNKLVMKIAKYCDHVSEKTPIQSFQTFTGAPRPGTYAQPVELPYAYSKDMNILAFLEDYKSPYEQTYDDIQAILTALLKKDYTILKDKIPSPTARIDLIRTLIRIAPTKSVGLSITFTGWKEEFKDSPFKFNFIPDMKETMVSWLEEEHIPDMVNYQGILRAIDTSVYSLDVKVELDIGKLLRCLNYDEAYDYLVPMLNIGDKISIIGIAKEIPGHYLRMEDIFDFKILEKVGFEDKDSPLVLNEPIENYLEGDENDQLEEWTALAEDAFEIWNEEEEEQAWQNIQKEI